MISITRQLAIFIVLQSLYNNCTATECKVSQDFFRSGTWASNLYKLKGTGTCELKQYFNGEETLPEVSILFIGDSIDRNAVHYACDKLGANYKTFLNSDVKSKLAYKYCKAENLVLGSFFNFGISQPPYYFKAYLDFKKRLMPKGINNMFREHIIHDSRKFNEINDVYGQIEIE